VEKDIVELRKGKAGPQGPIGKTGKQGKRGLPGKDGKQLDKEYIAAQMATFVKEFNLKIAAVDTAAKKGNAEALKHVSDVSIKLGNQIQSAAKDLHNQIRAVEQSAHNKIESTEKALAKQISEVRKMPGPQGDKGAQGIQGATGLRGPQGDKGAQGIQGTTGLLGPQGVKGAEGIQGATGLPGPQGVKGAQGIQGATGDKGAQGIQGATGLRGPQGDKGAAGERGAPGAQGAAGARGEADLSLIDVCGAIGGSDSTCARKPLATGSAYAVGDPHYKSWDGAEFNFQPGTIWGEIVLFHHKRMQGGDIEVQTATVPYPNGSPNDESTRANNEPKCATAVAIAAWGNVIVFYARNGLNSYFLNDKTVTWGPDHVMMQLSQGIRFSKTGAKVVFMIDNGLGYLKITATMWSGKYFDIEGEASGSWATGKSTTGIWGDWDGDKGNDERFRNALNAEGKLSVLGTPRSYFKDKKPRTNTNGQFMLAFDMELDASQNHVIPGETITVDIQEPEKQCPPEKAATVAKFCVGLFGSSLANCGSDICLGGDPAHSASSAHVDQIQRHSMKLLPPTNPEQQGDTCILFDEIKRFDKVPSNGGGSFAFSTWIKQEGLKLEGTIAKKGSEWSLQSNDEGDITFISNGKSCKAAKAIGLKYKNIIAVSSATEKKIQVIVDGQVECSVSAETFAESKDGELQLGSLSHHIEAKVAKPTYVGSGVRLQEADLFFKEKPQCIGA